MNDLADFPTPTIVAVNGVDLEVFEAGQRHAGNPIVLCHGWPEHAFSWRHQISVLAHAGYHVVVDRGHWIQEELPDETNQTILGWLGRDRVA